MCALSWDPGVQRMKVCSFELYTFMMHPAFHISSAIIHLVLTCFIGLIQFSKIEDLFMIILAVCHTVFQPPSNFGLYEPGQFSIIHFQLNVLVSQQQQQPSLLVPSKLG
jgi:hypothetical protein